MWKFFTVSMSLWLENKQTNKKKKQMFQLSKLTDLEKTE